MKSDPKACPESPTRPGFSRRQVLGGSAVAAAALLGRQAQARALVRPPAGGTQRDVLVVVFLRGAMDGLATVVPYGDPDYYVHRPTLAIAPPGEPDGALDLDGFFGLAPAAAPLLTPYASGHLAFVHASGSIDPTRSHFDGFLRMEFGDPSLPVGTVSDGWLARYLHQTTSLATGELRAVMAGSFLPLSLRGAPKSLPIPDFGNFRFPGDPATAQQRVDVLGQRYALSPAPVGPSALSTFASIELMAGIDFAGYVPENGAQYPATGLGFQMRNNAALIKADVGVEAITVDYGGWDLHATLGPIDGPMAYLLDDLARALEAFYTDLGPAIDRVTVVCLSEFGRRVAENASLGTDHGHGNAMIVMGGHVNGGQVIADWPGLAPGELDSGLDLAITIDYRDILGEILAQRMAAPDIGAIFPQHSFVTHGITV
jgi:uncharacterized protein (DUF1501 family)